MMWNYSIINKDIEDLFNILSMGTNDKDRISLNITDTQTGKRIYEFFVPGLQKEDLTVKIVKDVLSISINRKKEEKNDDKKSPRYIHQEYDFFDQATRLVKLPKLIDLDSHSISLKDGILKIEFSKTRESDEKEKILEIS